MTEITEEKLNRLKAQYLMDNVLLESVRIRFEKYLPSNRLPGILFEKKDHLDGCGLIYRYQHGTLYPKSGRQSSDNYDINLMISLLRALTAIKKPKNGFDKLPETSEILDGADLARIKFYRNIVFHKKCKVEEMSTSCLNDMVDMLQPAAERLSGKKLDKEFDDVLNGLHIEIRDEPASIRKDVLNGLHIEIRDAPASIRKYHDRTVVKIKQLTVVGVTTVLYIWPNLDSISFDTIISYKSFSVFKDIVHSLKGSQDQIKDPREQFTCSSVNANNTNIQRNCSFKEDDQCHTMSAVLSCIPEKNNNGTCTPENQGGSFCHSVQAVESQSMDKHSADSHNKSTCKNSVPLQSGGCSFNEGDQSHHISAIHLGIPEKNNTGMCTPEPQDGSVCHSVQAGGCVGAGSYVIYRNTTQLEDSSWLQFLRNLPGAGYWFELIDEYSWYCEQLADCCRFLFIICILLLVFFLLLRRLRMY